MTSIPEPNLPAPRAKSKRNTFANAQQMEAQAAEAQANTPKPVTPKVAPPVAAKPDQQNPKRMGGTKDILLSLPEELKNRMQATLAFTYPYTGIKHQQVFIRAAITQLCAEMERQYNNGEQWPLPADLQDN